MFDGGLRFRVRQAQVTDLLTPDVRDVKIVGVMRYRDAGRDAFALAFADGQGAMSGQKAVMEGEAVDDLIRGAATKQFSAVRGKRDSIKGVVDVGTRDDRGGGNFDDGDFVLTITGVKDSG